MGSQIEHNPRVVFLNSEAEVRQALDKIRTDPAGVDIMVPKFVHRCIKLSGVSLKAAIILKQEMLARGGEAAVAREVASLGTETTDVLLSATFAQYRALIAKLRRQPFGLSRVAAEIEAVLSAYDRPAVTGEVLSARDISLPLGRKTYVMGILNITPDSFSDGGLYLDVEAAVARARQMVQDGADIIDVGGESTRPSAPPVSLEDELARVIPVIKRLVNDLKVPISVDTTKLGVAAQALENGAHIINDISGLEADREIGRVAARYGAAVILQHRQGDPRDMQSNPIYTDLIGEVLSYLRNSVRTAVHQGLSRDRLIIDPGIGFGKTLDHNLEILRRLPEFQVLGLPIMVGTSRKSFIGKVLELPVDDRVEGTAATVALSIAGGADFVRVHDVREMARVVRMTDAVMR